MVNSPKTAIMAAKNQLDEGVSLMEKAVKKIYPIIREVNKRLVKEKQRKPHFKGKKGSNMLFNFKDENKSERNKKLEKELDEIIKQDEDKYGLEDIINKEVYDPDYEFEEKLDMRAVLGYFNQSEWISNINIGNIMQINPFSIQDFLTTHKNDYQLSRTSFLDKISLLAVGYFCASTEIRFILQLNENPSFKKAEKEPESEYWHAKSLEIACCFLPSDCPLVNHILLSYQKHHSPAQQPISEDKVSDDIIETLKPLNGIESNKFTPLIRKVPNGEVILTPADFSPAYKVCRHMIVSYKNSLMNYIAGGSQDGSSNQDVSSTSKKKNKHETSNIEPGDEYNNFVEAKNSNSIGSNKQQEENSRSFKERHNSGQMDHTKSMGVVEGSHDSLLLEDDPAKNARETSATHSSFHKRPLSHNNGVRSKSSRQKRRKKTPVHNKNQQNTLISNTANTNSKLTQDVTDSDDVKTKKLVDDSKFGNKKSVITAGMRPKSSRGNRSFDSSGNNKVMGKTDTGFKQKRHSVAGVAPKSSNFGKKKNSYG